MAQVGQRPRQFNPIPRPRDNTDDLKQSAENARAKSRRRPQSDFTGFVDPAKPMTAPPMPSRTGEGSE